MIKKLHYTIEEVLDPSTATALEIEELADFNDELYRRASKQDKLDIEFLVMHCNICVDDPSDFCDELANEGWQICVNTK